MKPNQEFKASMLFVVIEQPEVFFCAFVAESFPDSKDIFDNYVSCQFRTNSSRPSTQDDTINA